MNETRACSSPSDLANQRVEVISNGSVGYVALCGCGNLHLNLQYLTLRFEPAAFRELAALLAHAQRRLDSDPMLQASNDPGDAMAPPVH